MQEINDTMEEYQYRVEVIERNLKSTNLSDEARFVSNELGLAETFRY